MKKAAVTLVSYCGFGIGLCINYKPQFNTWSRAVYLACAAAASSCLSLP